MHIEHRAHCTGTLFSELLSSYFFFFNFYRSYRNVARLHVRLLFTLILKSKCLWAAGLSAGDRLSTTRLAFQPEVVKSFFPPKTSEQATNIQDWTPALSTLIRCHLSCNDKANRFKWKLTRGPAEAVSSLRQCGSKSRRRKMEDNRGAQHKEKRNQQSKPKSKWFGSHLIYQRGLKGGILWATLVLFFFFFFCRCARVCIYAHALVLVLYHVVVLRCLAGLSLPRHPWK